MPGLLLLKVLSFLKQEALAAALNRAVACHVREGKLMTRDMGGLATTKEMGQALRTALQNEFAGSLSC